MRFEFSPEAKAEFSDGESYYERHLSAGRCRLVMVKDKRWEWIEQTLSPLPVRQD